MDLTNWVFHNYLDSFVVVLIDDILVYSMSWEKHRSSSSCAGDTAEEEIVCQTLKVWGFLLEKVSFLEHVISKEGVLVDSSKIEPVAKWETPTNIQEVRSFLGLVGYYQKFVERFSEISDPLTTLTRKNAQYIWIKDC